MPRTVILSSARTPIGKLGGGLSTLPATHLGGVAIREALQRADVDPAQVEHVVMGSVLQAGQGQIPSRQAQINAGIPIDVTSETINKVCASSVRAVGMLDQAVRAGDVEIAVGGGMESMSQAPYLLPGARQGFRMGDVKALDAMVEDGLRNAVHRQADVRGGRRDRQRARDDPRRPRQVGAAQPRARGRGHRRGPPGRRDRLRHGHGPQGRHGRRGRRGAAPRLDASRRWPSSPAWSRAARTPPATRRASTTARARSCWRREEWAERNGKEILGTIVAQAAVADEFAWLARTPANAAKKALDKAGLQPGDIDLWEINEAFSSVALNSTRMLGIDEERVNVNGGAVALGHPIGASGARILGSLVLELRRRGGGYGCVAICSGGGQGDAVIVHV